MSKCTATEAIKAFEYWIGYKEKRSDKYTHSREKQYFTADAGSANYTYFGYYCGLNPAQWCAMSVTVAIVEACNGDREAARYIMGGVFPFVSCGQIIDACPEIFEKRVPATPRRGDIIIFSGDGNSRDHTGIVYDIDSTYVYTIEGNSNNECRKRQYVRSDNYIYGYVHPRYAAETDTGETYNCHYDEFCYPAIPELSKGNAGYAVSILQFALAGMNFYDINQIDGIFGNVTKEAVKQFQSANKLEIDGICGKETWKKIFEN